MKSVDRIRIGMTALFAAGVMAAGTTIAQAQGGFGGGMPPEIQAKIKAWGKYRESHKHLSSLSDMMRQIMTINKDPQYADYAFNKQQSAKMLTVLSTWRTKPALSEDQATEVQKQVSAFLTAKQIQKMSTIKGFGQGGGGGRPGGGGGFGGGGGRPAGGGPPGGFKFPDPPKGSYNPLNPDTLPFEQFKPMAKKGMEDFTAELQKKAKS